MCCRAHPAASQIIIRIIKIIILIIIALFRTVIYKGHDIKQKKSERERRLNIRLYTRQLIITYASARHTDGTSDAQSTRTEDPATPAAALSDESDDGVPRLFHCTPHPLLGEATQHS